MAHIIGTRIEEGIEPSASVDMSAQQTPEIAKEPETGNLSDFLSKIVQVIGDLIKSITEALNPFKEAEKELNFNNIIGDSVVDGTFDTSLEEATDNEIDQMIRAFGKEKGLTDEDITQNYLGNEDIRTAMGDAYKQTVQENPEDFVGGLHTNVNSIMEERGLSMEETTPGLTENSELDDKISSVYDAYKDTVGQIKSEYDGSALGLGAFEYQNPDNVKSLFMDKLDDRFDLTDAQKESLSGELDNLVEESGMGSAGADLLKNPEKQRQIFEKMSSIAQDKGIYDNLPAPKETSLTQPTASGKETAETPETGVGTDKGTTGKEADVNIDSSGEQSQWATTVVNEIGKNLSGLGNSFMSAVSNAMDSSQSILDGTHDTQDIDNR